MAKAIKELSVNEIVMSVIALMIVGTFLYIVAQGADVPEQLSIPVGFVFAYYFRQGSDGQANRVFEKMNGKAKSASKVMQAVT